WNSIHSCLRFSILRNVGLHFFRPTSALRNVNSIGPFLLMRQPQALAYVKIRFLRAPQIVKLPEAKKGFVLLPRGWVAERSFGWASQFRRLARDYERLPETLAGLHFVVSAMLVLVQAVPIFQSA
ncbi:transposase, partial [Burkholderia cenocepacia]|uniref:transposase n=3 Tax=Burkholderia cenocepacia TaxID=95486 RepID=UPI001F09D49E